MDRRKVYKVPRVVENKVKEINDLIRWAKDKDGIVGGYFGSTYYSYLNFKKPITIRNQFVYIEYHDGGKLVKERYNFNKETGFNSLEELKWELSRILRAYRKAKKDYDTKGYFQKGGSLKGSKKKPRVAKEQKGRSFEDAWGRFKKDIRDNTTPRKMAKGGSTNRKGRKETSFKQDVISDVEQAKLLMDKGFYLVENNTALEHKEGGYQKISKRVSNFFNKKMARGGDIDKIRKEGLDKLGLNQRTEFIDVTSGKRTFRIRRVVALDDKTNYPNRAYYSSDNGDEIYYVENEKLHKVSLDDNLKERIMSYPQTRVKLKYGKFQKGGKIDEKIKILKKEGYPHKQAVAIALSMRDSGKLARGGKVKDFEKGKWLQGKQWHIYKNNGWQLERYRGDNLIEQYSISVEKGDVDFIKYTPNYEGRIKIPENVQLKVIKLLSKVNPKFNFGDEYENQIRVNQYSDMYARGGEVNKLNMKNEQQIEKRIDKLNNRIKLLDLRYEATKSEYLFNQIKSLEIQVNLLRWTLGKDEVYDKGGKIKEFISYDIPQSYAYALINADSSALSDKDEELLNEFVDDVKDQFGNAYFLTGGEESFEPRFEPSNDVVYNQGSDVVTLYINPSNS